MEKSALRESFNFEKIKLIESNNKFHLHLVQTNQYVLRFELEGYNEEKSMMDYIYVNGDKKIKLYVEQNESTSNFKFVLLADIESDTLEGIIDILNVLDIKDPEKIKFKIPSKEDLQKQALLIKLLHEEFRKERNR
jgi:hypothetical protein